jgi:hypothetical protein
MGGRRPMRTPSSITRFINANLASRSSCPTPSRKMPAQMEPGSTNMHEGKTDVESLPFFEIK